MPAVTVDSDIIKSVIQAAFLIIAWFIKRDLAEIKEDGKANRLMNELTASGQKEHKGVCEERHRLEGIAQTERFAVFEKEIEHIRQRKDVKHPEP